MFFFICGDMQDRLYSIFILTIEVIAKVAVFFTPHETFAKIKGLTCG